MYTFPLPWPDSSLLLSAPLGWMHPALRFSLLAALVFVPLALLFILYRYELRLVPRFTALSLLGLRLMAFALVLLLLCAQPIYARDRRFSLPGRVIVVVDRSASLDVPDPQREPADKLRLARALGMARDIDPKLFSLWIEDYQAKRPPRWLLPDEEKQQEKEKKRDLGRETQRRKAHDDLLKAVDELTRTTIAHHILARDGLDVMGKLASKHNVEVYAVDRGLRELKPNEIEQLFAAPQKKDDSNFTDLRAPLVRALERSGPGHGKILGIVLLTDGQHNVGTTPPGDKARELGERSIPIFPVALGERRSPPDVAVVSVRGPNHTVFKDVTADIEVRFKISGMQAQEFLVEVHREGQEKKLLATKTINHDGKDRDYVERFPIRLEDVGTQTITATVKPVKGGIGPKETVANNNALSTTVAVADDQARVLLVDGEARWEFHYLATALGRNRGVDLKSIVFEQPRLDDRLTTKELEKIGSPAQDWPKEPDALSGYSCIILGDVDPEKLTATERKRLEEYVANAGGTLIVLAGKRFMPLAYPERGADGEWDPLRRLLPVEFPHVLSPEDGFPITLTRAGADVRFMKLPTDEEEAEDKEDSDNEKGVTRNDRLWAGFPRPWGWAVVGTAKPGATSLARVPQAKDPKQLTAEVERQNAVVARHNFGFGRVLFVGIDSTWRWRFKAGDQYHHRFWDNVIKWASADRPLVVGNESLRFGTPQPVYRHGEAVEIVARISEKVGQLRPEMLAGARVMMGEGEKQVAMVPLLRRPGQPRVLEGPLRDLPPGKYAFELAIPDLSDKLNGKDGKQLRATFTVLPPESKETADLERNDPLLQDLAVRSGGKVYTVEDVSELAERLKNQGIDHVEHHEQRLWQWWPLLVLIVALLTLEWVGRKLSGLP